MVDKHTREHQAMVEGYTQETQAMFVERIQDIKAHYIAYYQQILEQKEAIIDEYAEHMDKLRLDCERFAMRMRNAEDRIQNLDSLGKGYIRLKKGSAVDTAAAGKLKILRDIFEMDPEQTLSVRS